MRGSRVFSNPVTYFVYMIIMLCTCTALLYTWNIYVPASVPYSVSGQLLETFWLPIKSQPIFITQSSSLHLSIACCLVSLETKFQFCDTFRCKMTMKILEHVISELSDSKTNYRTALLSCAFLRTNYWIGHRVLLITSLWVIGSFKDFCRKFSYVSIVSGKVLFEKQ